MKLALFKIIGVLVLAGGLSLHVPAQNVLTDGFPNRVGDTWTYLVRTSLLKDGSGYGGVPDTVSLTIIGDGFYNGDSVKIWQFKGRKLSEDFELWIADKTEKIIITEAPAKLNRIPGVSGRVWPSLMFPLKTGNSTGTALNGVVTVKGISDIKVSAGNFTGCYEIDRAGGGFNCYFGNKFWYKENVGFVKFTVSVGDMCSDWANGDWELLSYQLKS
jgi:hypothetical protein